MKSAGKRNTLLNLLVSRWPGIDRQWLYSRIVCGDVLVDGHREKDPKRNLSSKSTLGYTPRMTGELEILSAGKAPSNTDESHEQERTYVSRGGRKLAPVLEPAAALGFAWKNRILLDAGASTGGFTDCLLQHGAAAVHAVDVGYNQLDYRLRSDERVLVRERCNIMSLEPGDLEPPPGAAVADLSFRSMEGVAARILQLLEPPATEPPLLLALIKPQFELEYSGLKREGFDGILDDPDLIDAVLQNVQRRLLDEGIQVVGQWPAGITGTRGNQEYFFLLTNHIVGAPDDSI